ncbi:MAG: 1-acyl-sn-glycerol-3-phosphate acyltransferase [Alphaproteobacteria bacterium]|nr:1-acyl-sn-glycerol-3-phosphate acyltransferase [Alphaproteobacteria bacterium]
MGSNVLAVRRLVLYVLLTIVSLPVQAALLLLRSPWRARFPVFFHKSCLRILGIELVVHGTLCRDRPALFVANHSSYLDIMVLGSLVSGSFIAKSEVKDWPFFGLLARMQRTVFVDRKQASVALHRSSIQTRLEAGEQLILFPEGTSSDGNRTLPFKSALFSVAQLRIGDAPLPVQPVSVSCTALDGIPLGRWLRPVYAWYGDMDLLPHIWNVAKAGKLSVSVVLHPVATIDENGSRKALAQACWEAVADGVARANSGRLGARARRRGWQAKWMEDRRRQRPAGGGEPGATDGQGRD